MRCKLFSRNKIGIGTAKMKVDRVAAYPVAVSEL